MNSDLPQGETAAPSVDPLKAKHSKLLREREKRHAAEQRAEAAEAQAVSDAKTIADLRAALDATREAADAELNKAATQIIQDRDAAAVALAEGRETAFQFGRTVERSGIVKASATIASLDKMSEADRRKIIDAAARPAPAPAPAPVPAPLGGSLAELATAYKAPAAPAASEPGFFSLAKLGVVDPTRGRGH